MSRICSNSGAPRGSASFGNGSGLKPNSKVISDPKAVETVERLGVDFGELEKGTNPTSEFFQVARARGLDDLVRAFLARKPKVTVACLGAGLDTAFHRVDSSLLRWFDMDLPEVIGLRRRLISETDRSRCISGSVLDPAWARAIGPTPDGAFLFASGILICFAKAELRRLFAMLVEAFPAEGTCEGWTGTQRSATRRLLGLCAHQGPELLET